MFSDGCDDGAAGNAGVYRDYTDLSHFDAANRKVDPERWLVLIKRGLGHWNFRVVGPEPFEVELVALTDHEAKNHALSMAQLKAANPKVIVPRFQQWRTALSADRMLPTA